jgi:phosphohistidine phosphatase
MVVGHMPFMQRLVSCLASGSEEMKIYQFQNSGIVCLDATDEPDGTLNWFIKWTLNPNIS